MDSIDFMKFGQQLGFDCSNQDCTVNVFVAPRSEVSIKWIRSQGDDYIELNAFCPCCKSRSVRYYKNAAEFRPLFNCMLEDLFRDIEPNIPEGV